MKAQNIFRLFILTLLFTIEILIVCAEAKECNICYELNGEFINCIIRDDKIDSATCYKCNDTARDRGGNRIEDKNFNPQKCTLDCKDICRNDNTLSPKCSIVPCNCCTDAIPNSNSIPGCSDDFKKSLCPQKNNQSKQNPSDVKKND